jgi:hypothetical protein
MVGLFYAEAGWSLVQSDYVHAEQLADVLIHIDALGLFAQQPPFHGETQRPAQAGIRLVVECADKRASQVKGHTIRLLACKRGEYSLSRCERHNHGPSLTRLSMREAY